MEDQPTPIQTTRGWLWWLMTALLAVAVAIDYNEGNSLKLTTSVLLFAACLLSAIIQPPRRGLAAALILTCFAGSLVLVAFRALGPGL